MHFGHLIIFLSTKGWMYVVGYGDLGMLQHGSKI